MPLTVTVEIRDDQNLIVASGQEVTVSRQEMIDAVNNIQTEYDNIIDNLVAYNNRISTITRICFFIRIYVININLYAIFNQIYFKRK